MRAVARVELVPELLCERDVAAENDRREQPLQEVVVAAAADTSRQPEHARVGVCLEHGADDVCGCSEPVGQRTAAALEIERREWPLRADPVEHVLRDPG